MTAKKLNRILGNCLGCNPAGEPLYKWMNSNEWFHLMRKINDFEEGRSESGLLVTIDPKYVYRKMVDADDIWMLAHWHEPISQMSWEMQYGTSLLWPRGGYYAPTDICLGPGEEPSEAVNEQVIGMVKRNRSKTFADHLADGEAIVERREKRIGDDISDRIDDSVTAFCNVPGTRSAHVSFPSVQTKDL